MQKKKGNVIDLPQKLIHKHTHTHTHTHTKLVFPEKVRSFFQPNDQASTIPISLLVLAAEGLGFKLMLPSSNYLCQTCDAISSFLYMIFFASDFTSKVLQHIDFYCILRPFIKVGKATLHSAPSCFLQGSPALSRNSIYVRYITLPFMYQKITATSLFLLYIRRSQYIQSQEEFHAFCSILAALTHLQVFGIYMNQEVQILPSQ